MDYLSLCLIAKDEDAYLKEWLDYHILIGVDRFYIYDNGSEKPIRQELKDYIDRGWLIVYEINGQAVQLMAYQHCLKTHSKDSKWIGFIDADEFIVLSGDQNIKEFMQSFEAFAGLAVSSVFYGPSVNKCRPVGGQIINYQERLPFRYDDNNLVKSIVQPEKVLFPNSPHDFTYKAPYYCVNVDKKRVDKQRFPINHSRIRLNHYFTRSEEEFNTKLKRLGGDGRRIKKDKLTYISELPVFEDELIFDYLAKRVVSFSNRGNSFKRNDPGFINFLHESAKKCFPSQEICDFKIEEFSINPKDFLPDDMLLTQEVNQAKKDGNWALAKKLLLKSIQNNPTMVVKYTGYATTCLFIGDIVEAKKVLELALTRFGKTYEVLRVIADYWIAVKDYGQAEQIFLALLQIGDELDILMRLSYVQLLLGNYSGACKNTFNAVQFYHFSQDWKDDFYKKILIDVYKILSSEKKNEETKFIYDKLHHHIVELNKI